MQPMDAISVPQNELSRGTYIGGSDLLDVLSEEPYGCARRLWYQKRRTKPDYDSLITGPMVRGSKLEDVFAEEYEYLTGRTVRRRQGTRDAEHPELGGHIDRHIVAFDERGPGVLEIKSMNEWAFRHVRKEGLSAGHIMQLQFYIRRQGWRWGSYLIGNADSWRFEWFDVAYDPELCEELDRAALDLWQMVTAPESEGPKRLKVNDPRCQGCAYRTSCQGKELEKLVGRVESIEDDADLAPYIAEYFNLKQLADEAAEELENWKEAIKERVGHRAAVAAPGGKILYQTVKSFRLDAASVELLCRDLQRTYEELMAFYGPLLASAEANPRSKKKAYLPDLDALSALVERSKQLKKESITRPFRIFAA
jgi:predicted phage-related endonuclease